MGKKMCIGSKPRCSKGELKKCVCGSPLATYRAEMTASSVDDAPLALRLMEYNTWSSAESLLFSTPPSLKSTENKKAMRRRHEQIILGELLVALRPHMSCRGCFGNKIFVQWLGCQTCFCEASPVVVASFSHHPRGWRERSVSSHLAYEPLDVSAAADVADASVNVIFDGGSFFGEHPRDPRDPKDPLDPKDTKDPKDTAEGQNRKRCECERCREMMGFRFSTSSECCRVRPLICALAVPDQQQPVLELFPSPSSTSTTATSLSSTPPQTIRI